MEHRYAVIEAMYGKEGLQKISNSKILVIGSGGIGCEILKNLALSGFKNIDLIDLDTIDVSNLNRQFLFRPEHVGQSKAKIAAAATNKFNPDVNVTAKHGNIKDGNFDMNYFGKFTLVLNALDNIDARRHVNRLCLANKIPLIDAGTQGYLGQVMPILKGKTECYECTPKPIPKTYPICTIRSTPDKPVHCLVWAKECFKLLFGVTEESMLFEDPQSGDTSTYMHLVPLPTDLANSPLESVSISVVVTYGQKLLTALYDDEIQKRLDMGTYTTAKVVPKSLESVNIETAVKIAREILQNSASTVTRPSKMPNWDKQLWSAVDCCVEFLICVHELLFTASFAASRGRLEFDKDCDPIMRFVCATAVLRSHLFGIELVDYHRAKGIAGNIIPAIATTNAIVAGLQVLQAIQYITKLGDVVDEKAVETAFEFPHIYCVRAPTRKGYYLQPCKAESPSTSCYVCNTAQLTLHIDTHEATLEFLVKKVLKGRLGFNQPSIVQGSNFLYEEGEDAEESLAENLPLMLDMCPGGGLVDGSLITVEDFSQELTVLVLLRHRDNASFAENPEDAVASDLFLLGGSVTAPSLPAEGQPTTSGSTAQTSNASAVDSSGDMVMDEDDLVFVSDTSAPDTAVSSTATGKRSRSKDDEGEEEVEVEEEDPTKKKQRC